MPPLLLASASATRLQLLRAAGLDITARAARIDEAALRMSLRAEAAKPRDIADALAEIKARKLGLQSPGSVVIGADQILALKDEILAKPDSLADARRQLRALRGQTHHLHTAVVLYHEARPIWRHLATAKLTMRDLSDGFLDGYLARHWPAVGQSVGAYQIESEGIRLFSAVEGDYFGILGLPLTPLLNYLASRGFIPS